MLRGVGDVFKALADPTRRAILDELQERDDQTLFELCTRLISRHGLGSSRQAISQHLDVLEDGRPGPHPPRGSLQVPRPGHRAAAGPSPTGGRSTPEEDDHADQPGQRPGRRPGEGAALLHRRARLREEDRRSRWASTGGSPSSRRRTRTASSSLLEPDEHPAARPFKEALVADGIPFTSFAVDDVHDGVRAADARSASASPRSRRRWAR